ncbi:phenylacetic acid degradation operon negative regulatory protein PaaX [Magnetospirillum moscoviense]|uniref:Phenylacetic acid degradation operon negative regulatory protein PaaX n=1 Tax=Magnetospirillum moscoviense TaxID=1437059 RepID=A0A178MNV6_9PROT|nr:phenylacetic acid degradation operon negative regulatory protein PaaX [Magnetospirillum moscoviense]OAN50482.1 phenylacetic acid degradation operon negative regulatory protein PaaX [Magnetospirillum moscoviense]
MTQDQAAIVARLLDRLKPKAKSLIVTVYGDAIAHHGGNAWLGSVIALVEPLGLNERIVRTSVFRLSKEEWLVSSQLGRRSYYRLTESGRRRFEAAHERVYRPSTRPWDGRWTLVITSGAVPPGEDREALRRDLGWLGFGQLAPGIKIHPDPDETALRLLLADSPAARNAVVMRAETLALTASEGLGDIIRSCWDLDRLGADYTEFLETFRPVWQALKDDPDLDPQTCFVVRTLLMHGYRRALLRDPMLPDELLGADWPGTAARQLCRNLYRLVQAPAEQHLMAVLETAEGPVPEAHPSYYARFGGL